MGSYSPPGSETVLSDRQVTAWIAAELVVEPDVSWSRLLRRFRDTPGMHCEQTRFRDLVAKLRA